MSVLTIVVHVLVLKARHLYGSACSLFGVGVTDEALRWCLLGFVEDKLFELSCRK